MGRTRRKNGNSTGAKATERTYQPIVTLHHHEACDPVAWPETLVSLACPFAALTGIIPEKGHSPKAHCLWLLSYPSPLFFFPPLFVLQILMMEIPSCTALPPILHTRK